MLGGPVGTWHTRSEPLPLRVLDLWGEGVLQKAFRFIPRLNAVHFMNLTVQETFRIETHIQIFFGFFAQLLQSLLMIWETGPYNRLNSFFSQHTGQNDHQSHREEAQNADG